MIQPFDIVRPYPFVGHVPFVYWLVQTIKPKLIVELGTHSGNSYMSMCKAVHDNDLKSECFAVDTWTGDFQSGYYSDYVLQELKKRHKKYESFSTLMRMTFDEAVHLFRDHSINLLHIDGLHTYEAVVHDFITWQPKLAKDAVVLFHDIETHRDGYGVHKLWSELKQIYKTDEFKHSFGLGILYWGEKPKQMAKINFEYLESVGKLLLEQAEKGAL